MFVAIECRPRVARVVQGCGFRVGMIRPHLAVLPVQHVHHEPHYHVMPAYPVQHHQDVVVMHEERYPETVCHVQHRVTEVSAPSCGCHDHHHDHHGHYHRFGRF